MRTSESTVQEDMPRPPSDAVQIAIRVPQDWLARADDLARLISRPGFEASRTDAFRAAIARGFDELLGELKRSRQHERLRFVGDRDRVHQAAMLSGLFEVQVDDGLMTYTLLHGHETVGPFTDPDEAIATIATWPGSLFKGFEHGKPVPPKPTKTKR